MFSVRVHLLECQRSYAYEVLSTGLPKQAPNKDGTNRFDNVEGTSHRAQILDKKLQATNKY